MTEYSRQIYGLGRYAYAGSENDDDDDDDDDDGGGDSEATSSYQLRKRNFQ